MTLPKTLISLTAILLITGLTITACKKDKSSQIRIIGTWINTSNYGNGTATYRETYQFNSNNSMVFERTLLDATTNKLIGYSTIIEAQYELKGDSLRFYNTSTYYYPTQPYYGANKQDLTLVASNQTYTNRIVFDGADSFHFQYNCPPNALCVAPLNYSRQTSH